MLSAVRAGIWPNGVRRDGLCVVRPSTFRPFRRFPSCPPPVQGYCRIESLGILGSRAGEQVTAIKVRYGRGITLQLDFLNLDGPIAAALLQALGFDSHQVREILEMA